MDVDLLLGSLVLGMAVLVVARYAPLAVKTRQVMPAHVAAIALSYVLLILRAQTDFKPLGYAAYVIGIVALTFVLRGVRDRRRALE